LPQSVIGDDKLQLLGTTTYSASTGQNYLKVCQVVRALRPPRLKRDKRCFFVPELYWIHKDKVGYRPVSNVFATLLCSIRDLAELVLAAKSTSSLENASPCEDHES
jgi:hypothetical protein